MTAPLILLFGSVLLLAGGRLVHAPRLLLCVALLTLAAAAVPVAGLFERASAALPAGSDWLVNDSLTAATSWLAVALGVLLVLTAAGSGTDQRSIDRLGLILLALAGLILAASGQDLVLTFAAVEVVSLSTTAACLPVAAGGPPAAHLMAQRTISSPVGTSSEQPSPVADDAQVIRAAGGPPTAAAATPTSTGQTLWPPLAAWTALLPGAISSALLLLGFTLLFGLTASTSLGEIRTVLAASYGPDAALAVGRGSVLGVAAVVLIFAGLGWRLAVVPFHFGLLEVWTADLKGAALLAILPRATAFVVLVRVVVDAMPGFEDTARQLAMLLAGLTLLIAGARALSRSSLRPMLADLIVAQGGFALAGLAAALAHPDRQTGLATGGFGAPGGTAAAFLFLAISLTATAGLFAALVSLGPPRSEAQHIDDLAGLARTRPGTAVCVAICVLALAGLPPVAGFWSRWLIALAALTAPAEASASGIIGLDAGFVLLVLAAAVGTLLSAAVAVRLLEPMLLVGPLARPAPATRRAAIAAATLAATTLALASALPGETAQLLTGGPQAHNHDRPAGAGFARRDMRK